MPSIGLQEHIWQNNSKSIALLLSYPVIIMTMCWALAYLLVPSDFISSGAGQYINQDIPRTSVATDFIFQYWPIIISVIGLWFGIAYMFQTKMIRALSHSHPVTRKEEPELYNLLENLCISVGMTMPRLEIIETHARNAFASGVNDKTYTVTVTRGLIQSLTKEEVEAVLAHELTHIMNRDVRLLIVTIIFTSMLGFAAQIVWSNLRYSLWVPRRRSGNSNGNGILLLYGAAIILWAGYFATLFTRFALSRKREYMADAGAIQLTRNPEAMMAALLRISGMESIPKMPADIGFMCIENSKPFLGLFATHPPMNKRIEVISQTTNTPIPQLKPKERAPRSEAAIPPSDNRDNWITRERFGKNRNPWTR